MAFPSSMLTVGFSSVFFSSAFFGSAGAPSSAWPDVATTPRINKSGRPYFLIALINICFLYPMRRSVRQEKRLVLRDIQYPTLCPQTPRSDRRSRSLALDAVTRRRFRFPSRMLLPRSRREPGVLREKKNHLPALLIRQHRLPPGHRRAP